MSTRNADVMSQSDKNNPIRNEILAGRPLLVLATPEMEAAVVEAARIAGRLADLVVVAGDKGLGHAFTEGGARFFRPPEDIADEASENSNLGEPPMDGVPLLTAEAIDPGHSIVVVRGGRFSPGFGRDILRWVETCAAEGGTLPHAEHPVTVRPITDRDPGDTRRIVTFSAGDRRCMALGWAASPGREHPQGGWAEAKADFLRKVEDDRPGLNLHAVSSGDRLAIACFTVTPTSPGGECMPRVVIYDVDADGLLTVGVVSGGEGRPDKDALARIATDAFLGGPSNVGSNVPGMLRVGIFARIRFLAMRLALEAVLAEPGDVLHDPSSAALRATLERRVDLPLHQAASWAAHPEAVVGTVLRGGEHRAARREFCLTWWALSGLILDPAVRAAVDSGDETVPAVAAALDVTPAVARRLVGRRHLPLFVCSAGFPRARDGRSFEHSKSYHAGPFLGAFGHDRLPPAGDDREWAAFVRMADIAFSVTTSSLAARHRTPPSEIAALLLGGEGSSWSGRLSALEAAVPDLDRFRDCGDMILAFSQWLGAMFRVADPSLAFRAMAGHGSLARLHDASLRWHATPDLGAPVDAKATWPVPFAPVDLGGGIVAVAIADAQALADEGRDGPDADGVEGLSHCVGGYAERCMTGKSLVVGLRRTVDGRTTRLSTAELWPDPAGQVRIGAKGYRVVQHRAKANTKTCAAADWALGELLARVGGGRVAIDEAALEPRPGPSRDVPMDAETALRLHGAWRRIMPMAIRDLEPDALEGFLRTLDRRVSPPSAFDRPTAPETMSPLDQRRIRAEIAQAIHGN